MPQEPSGPDMVELYAYRLLDDLAILTRGSRISSRARSVSMSVALLQYIMFTIRLWSNSCFHTASR
jgi:hypothetical protein